MRDTKDLVAVLETVTAARREYQAAYDAAVISLAATGPQPDEREMQTLGAIVRQLENAARELRDALASVRQLDAVRASAAA